MRKCRTALNSGLLIASVLVVPSVAWAQDPPAAAPAPAAPAPAAAAPAAPAAPAEPAPAAPAAAAPAPETAQAGAAAGTQEAVPAPATAAAPAAAALEEHGASHAPTIGGHVEAAYHLSLTDPHSNHPVGLRSYDFAGGNTFMLHTAHLVVKHSFSDSLSAVIEFEGGSDPAANTALTYGAVGANNPTVAVAVPVLFDVQEAYGTYSAPFGLSVTAGKFVTYEGIEVVEGPLNPTITRGFLFGLAEPVTHVGAKAHYSIKSGDSEMANIGVGIVNGWDSWIDNNDAKTIIFRAGVTPVPQFWAALSGTLGAERTDALDPATGAHIDSQAEKDMRVSIDLTGAVIPTDSVTINFQGNFGSEPGVPTAFDPVTGLATTRVDGSWFGFGVQPVFKFGQASLGARFEYFADKNGTRTLSPIGTDLNVWNATITPGYSVDGWLVRAEFRFDSASEAIFTRNNAASEKSQSTVAAAVSYMF